MSNAITRPRLVIGAAALACVLAVPLAQSWGDPRATDSAGVSKKKFKKLKKRVKALEEQEQQPGPQGPPGEQGPRGLPGQGATNLFAYIRDPSSADSDAVVQYGSGVTAVVDGGPGVYLVTFDRGLEKCVVQAATGFGDPAGSATATAAFPRIMMNATGPHNTVNVQFVNANGSPIDTSFFITAFC